MVVARHQTLRAAIDWSYRLLPAGEQVVLRRLAVFAGTFDLEAAEGVVGDAAGDVGPAGPGFEVLDLLTRLVDKSLLVVLQHGRDVRYRLLETIREYAAEHLADAGETTESRQRHRDYFLALAVEGRRRAYELLEQGPWLRKVAAEHDNFRAALEWSLVLADDEAILRIAATLWQYWMLCGVVEGCDWLERALATPGSSAVGAHVEVCIGWGELQRDAGRKDGPPWIELLEAALAMALADGNRSATARARVRLSEAHLAAGRTDEAERLIHQALEYYEGAGSQPGVAFCLLYRSWVTIGLGNLTRALEELDRARELLDQAGEDFLLVHVLAQQAVVCALSGEAERAERLGEQAVAASRNFPGGQVRIMALVRAAEAAVLSGRLDRGREPLAELLVVLRDLGIRRWVAETLELAAMTIAHPHPEAGASLLGAAQALRESLGEPVSAGGVLAGKVQECHETLAGMLGAHEFDEYERTGRAMTMDDAILYTLGQLGVADRPAAPRSPAPSV